MYRRQLNECKANRSGNGREKLGGEYFSPPPAGKQNCYNAHFNGYAAVVTPFSLYTVQREVEPPNLDCHCQVDRLGGELSICRAGLRLFERIGRSQLELKHVATRRTYGYCLAMFPFSPRRSLASQSCQSARRGVEEKEKVDR